MVWFTCLDGHCQRSRVQWRVSFPQQTTFHIESSICAAAWLHWLLPLLLVLAWIWVAVCIQVWCIQSVCTSFLQSPPRHQHFSAFIDIFYYLALCSSTYDDINHFFQQLHITGHTYFYTSHDRGDWWENGSDKICLNLTNNLFFLFQLVSSLVLLLLW